MNKAGAASECAEAPLPGEALQETSAELGGTCAGSSANGSRTAPRRTQAQAEPPPKTVAQVLGEIIWLMTQSPRHKAVPLGDLEWLLMPAILLQQFQIFYRGEQPVGVALWALVDDMVARRIDANDKRLTAVEWKSGTSMRIIDIVAPFGGEAEVREQIDKEQQKSC
jgi:cytolysin-activating lysine-acyltransferase